MNNVINPIELTQKLISYPSITNEKTNIIKELKNIFNSLNFDCFHLCFNEKGSNFTENLYAKLGNAKPHLCFAGHTDTVPIGKLANWVANPFEGKIINNKLYGRGAADMKSAIACFISAISKHLYNKKKYGTISLIITNDEEGDAINGTKKVIEWLKKKDEKIDFCIVGEPTCSNNIGDTIKVGSRGSINGLLTIYGKQGHVAHPNKAQNPIPKLLKCLTKLSSQTLDPGTSKFPASNFEITSLNSINNTPNIIPDKANATFNIRFNDNHNEKTLTQWLNKICSQYTKKFSLNLSTTGRPYFVKPNNFFYTLLKSINEITNIKPKISTTGATSDARFIKDLCPAIEFGMINDSMHQVNENVGINDIITLTKIYEKMLNITFK